MNKIKDEFFRYISFCRSCRYFKNDLEKIVLSHMGTAKYALAYLLLIAMACVSIFTSRTQLPDGTGLSMDIFFTNWYMWVAAFMLLKAISTRCVQGSRLTPMSHRRKAVYYILRPVLICAIVCVCLIAAFWLIVIFIAIVQKLAGAIPSVDIEITQTSLYLLVPCAYLWHFSAIVFSFSVVLFIPALKNSWCKFAVCAGALAFYYVLSLIIINLSPFRPQRGLEYFANPIIALEYLPAWQGWLFAGIMAAAAVTAFVLAVVFTCRECKPKNF